jgi:exodeoxyribonuclease VII large subunit
MLFPEHFKLSDLAFLISQTIEKKFANKDIWVTAETSDIKNYFDRQYCFLTLVEKEENQIIAKMDAVIWRQQYGIIKAFTNATGIAFEKNIRLLLKVNIGFNPQYGLRLVVTAIDHSYTIGVLELERQAVLNKLVAENPSLVQFVNGEYHTYNMSLKLPLVLQKIALITATDSDGEKDFLHELSNNKFKYDYQVDSYLTQVQGKGAAENILMQLEKIETSGIKYDAVILARGGGSTLDFSAFDTYILGKKVAGFSIAIIAGIGHHRNVSITDLMCHQSVKTPTKAADFLVNHNQVFEGKIIALKQKMLDVSYDAIQQEKDNLKYVVTQYKYVVSDYLKNSLTNLNQFEIIVKHLNPSNILARGYAIIKKNNQIVSSGAGIKKGDKLEINLFQNTIEAIVETNQLNT